MNKMPVDGLRFKSFFLNFLISCTTLLCLIANAANATTTVPVVGCKPSMLTDGGPTQSGNPIEMDLPASISSKLAIYVGDHFAVLAPRGWICTYDTTGQKAEIDVLPSNNPKGIAQPIISERFSDVGTPSNVMRTLELGAQLFPKLITRSHLTNEASVLGYASPEQFLNSGRIIKVAPTDHLKYLSKNLVEYVTPPSTNGIGSQFLYSSRDGTLQATEIPTAYTSSGFVGLYLISNFSTPIENLKGLFILGIRLPNNLQNLSSYILKFGETNFEKSNFLRE